MIAPKPTDDYSHGQMMGMLVIIMMFEMAKENGVSVPDSTLQSIKDLAVEDLAEYLNKPTEDVLLLIEEELRNTK